jgi:hypothetical protein
MLVAVAVLFAPALSRAGEAFATVPDHHAQMMESGHCNSAPSPSGGGDESDEAGAKTCCMSVCLGVATAPAAAPEKVSLHGPAPSFALTNQYRGRIAEIATPPPKFA